MDVKLRLIGGSYAGKTYKIHRDLQMFKLPVRRELDLSTCRADSAVVFFNVQLEQYAVLNMGGGDVRYGIHEKLKMNDAMDEMWTIYKFNKIGD